MRTGARRLALISVLGSAIVAFVSAPSASAQDRGGAVRSLEVKPDAARLRPPKQAGNPCAQFGPGFAPAAGSDTCVRIGGGISVGVGGNAGSGR